MNWTRRMIHPKRMRDTTDDPPEEDEDADDPEGDDGKSDE